MSWFKTLRIKILEDSQDDLSKALCVSQTKISRFETHSNNEDLGREAFLYLQDYVREKTSISLPLIWYFKPPSSDDVLQYFHNSNIDPAAPKGTGKAGASLPPRDCYSSQKGVS